MFKSFKYLAAIALLFTANPAMAAAEAGTPAPEITTTDIDGKEFSLSALKGKTVVLEWTNHQCPFVVKHYETGNMQKLQKAATDDGVIWVSIVSSAEGRQGHVSPEEAKAIIKDTGAYPTVKILDASGEIGKLYGAKTTPHMFVINPEGNVVYTGAIDDNSSPRHDTVEDANNYVSAALASIKNGSEVETASTQPYGCAVKYAY